MDLVALVQLYSSLRELLQKNWGVEYDSDVTDDDYMTELHESGVTLTMPDPASLLVDEFTSQVDLWSLENAAAVEWFNQERLLYLEDHENIAACAEVTLGSATLYVMCVCVDKQFVISATEPR